jgi:small-conductance mechanosensitive channel
MTRLAGFDVALPPLLAVPVLVGLLLLVAMVAGRLVARFSRGWFHNPGDPDRPVPRVALPVTVALFSAGLLLLAPEVSVLGARGRLRAAVTVLLVVSCAMAATRLTVAGVSAYASTRPTMAPATSVARMAARIVIGILAVLMGLQSLGVPVTPLLTTLGIGSLAVALALQDTLANFFAGLYLLADRPVRPGDYVKLSEGGAEGYIENIGWRSARLRTLKGNTVIVPNQKLSQNILTNYNLPQADMILIVQVTVPFETDLAAVEGHLLDELLRAGGEVPEIVPRDQAVRLGELGPSGLVFLCVVRVKDFESQGVAGHELRRRIALRLKREGIPFSYPQQVVHAAAAPENRQSPRG